MLLIITRHATYQRRQTVEILFKRIIQMSLFDWNKFSSLLFPFQPEAIFERVWGHSRSKPLKKQARESLEFGGIGGASNKKTFLGGRIVFQLMQMWNSLVV